MCELRSLIYRLVISKSVKVAVSKKQEWLYGTPQFLFRSTVRLICNGAGTVRWYGTLQNRIEVRYAGTVRFKVRGT